MSYEDKFLFYLINIPVNEQFLDKVKEIQFTSLDWNYIIGKAIHHRIFPIFSKNLFFLATTDLENLIPQEVIAKVREVNYSFIGQNMVMHDESKEIFQSLTEKGIKFSPIKGVLLSELVYPERDLRFFRDIDLLFPNVNEMRRAEETLIKLGYDFFWTNSRGSTFRRNRHNILMDCDLHRSFSFFLFHEYPYFRPLIEDLWRKSTKEKISGIKVTVMSPEYMFIMVCLHSFHHKFFSLLDLLDAIQILRKNPEINWQFILKKIKEYPCALGLPLIIINSICTNFLRIKIAPETVLKTIYDDHMAISKLDWKSANKCLGDLRFPIPYMKFCRECVENCIFKYISVDNHENQIHTKISKYVHEYIYGYYCIITLARKRYGKKYALRCLFQQFTAPLGLFLGKSLKFICKKASMLGIHELLWS